MKKFRVIICLVIGLSFNACGPSGAATQPPESSTIPSTTDEFQTTPTSNGLTTRQTERVATVFALQTASATQLPTLTPSQTPSPAPTSTPLPTFVGPTLIPTIDPTLLPNLLKIAFSIQTNEGVNGHIMRKITGWDYGFGGEDHYGLCPGYKWLDTDHILFYPEAGQVARIVGDGLQRVMDVVPQAVVINLESGAVWLPSVSRSAQNCQHVYWSEELKILITLEANDENSRVSTYTADGTHLSSYTGHLINVSPRGTKILIGDDTLIDLSTNKAIKLTWSLEDYNEPILSALYWTYPKETRVYRCCYFYADLTSGISHRFQRSDFQNTNGNHLDSSGLWFHQGEWVRDNKLFLVHWLPVDDGDVKYLPLFDPATKLFYDLRKLAGIPREFSINQSYVSPDRNQILLVGWDGSYLVNLVTFESHLYPYREDSYTYTDTNWSMDSRFVWLQTLDSSTDLRDFQIVSTADKKITQLPVTPVSEWKHWWHPTEAIVVYPAAAKDVLIVLDAATMTYRELPFVLPKDPYAYSHVEWNPMGEKLALIAEDGSIWQVDYPTLSNLQQLTSSLPDISDLDWSPDGNSISFVSGSDIYVVETGK